MELPDFERLIDAPRHYAARTPDAPATWFEGATLTFSELDLAADACARGLIAQGVRPGDRVAVLSTPRPEFLVALLGVQRAGAIYVGINPSYTRREQLHVLHDSEPVRVLSIAGFVGRDFAAELAGLLAEVPSVKGCHRLDDGAAVGPLGAWADLLAAADMTAPLPEPAPHDAAALVYTSGSTGAPKGALLPHCALAYGAIVDARGMNVALPAGTSPRVACNLPTNHIGCIVDVCGTMLVSGGMTAFVEQFDPEGMLRMIEELHLTNLQHVPTVIQMLTMHPDFDTRDLSSLHVVAWGGAPLPLDTIRIYRAMGVHLQTVYGQTETIANITASAPGSTDEALAETVGQPNPDALVRIVDEEGNDVPDGVEGEVLYRHPAQFLGYFRNPEATARTITADGSIRTGDIAVRRADGNFSLVGRRSDMYKSGGLNVYPREVELELEAHPGVALAAIVGVPDGKYGEVGVAYVLRSPGARPTAEELAAWCKERVAGYKVPKRFDVRDELPLLPIGKVDKQALKADACFGG